MLKNAHKKIVSAGAVLADIMAFTNDDFITSHGFVKGARMQSIRPVISGLMTKLAGGYQMVPGGSACNTIIGAACLGAQTAFAAKCGQDQLGALLQRSLNENGVEAHISQSHLATGSCLSLVTPDGERTMLVDLGASDDLELKDVPENFFTNAGIAHFEAYTVQNRELMLNLLDRAYDAGCTISLDLGSFSIIKSNFDFLRQIINDYVDILIGNYAEGQAYTDIKDETRILAAMAQSNVSIAALKMGAKGSVIYAGGQIEHIQAVCDPNVEIVDTTGAGDLWNSGFLYGLTQGCGPKEAGRLASHCGFEVCRQAGARIPQEGWQRIKAALA